MQFTFYRAVKTFMKWYQVENDLDDWKNPIEEVKFQVPKDPPLELANAVAIKAILKTCKTNFTGKRDKAIILMLMGHADIQVLGRYLKQVNQDYLEVHRKSSPADRF